MNYEKFKGQKMNYKVMISNMLKISSTCSLREALRELFRIFVLKKSYYMNKDKIKKEISKLFRF